MILFFKTSDVICIIHVYSPNIWYDCNTEKHLYYSIIIGHHMMQKSNWPYCTIYIGLMNGDQIMCPFIDMCGEMKAGIRVRGISGYFLFRSQGISWIRSVIYFPYCNISVTRPVLVAWYGQEKDPDTLKLKNFCKGGMWSARFNC